MNGCWLVYATGGAIGVNYTTRFHVTLDDTDFFDARDSDFDWGYSVGGGIERKIFNRHWSMKVEYLYFSLDDQSLCNTQSGVTAHFEAHTFGHIVRGFELHLLIAANESFDVLLSGGSPASCYGPTTGRVVVHQ